MNNKIRIFLVLAGVVVIVITAFAGGAAWQANQLVASSAVAAGIPVDLSSFWKVWQLVNDNFVNTATTTKITSQSKVYGAIEGMVDSLGDPYSVFLTPEENKEFNEEIAGNFSGVGMEIGIRDNFITVISPLPDTPAKKAGIESGDKIIAIDDKPTAKMNVDQAIKLIRGQAGTPVSISVTRDDAGKPIVFKITRANIDVPTIEMKNLSGGITQIKLFSFGAKASESFAKAIKEFSQSGDKYLILDLRGNPGGYLNSAVDIASWFLPKGTPVVIEEHDRQSESKIYPSSGRELFTTPPKMVVLIDGGSASAAEILAGALRENGIAKLVGEQTFGKGSVQELFPVTKDTSLKLTIARWLTPHGVSISQNGLKPDYEIKMDSKHPDQDPQLEKAIEVIKNLK